MRTEIMSAVDFLSNLLRTRQLDSDLMESFKQNLNVLLCTHYQNHWFPEKPFKGSAYRCLRIVNQKMDPLLTKAGHSIGLSESSLLRMLPAELTMWVDPDEVSYRIGEDGSIGVLFEFDENTSLNSAGDSPTSESDSDSSLSADTSESEDPTQEILQTCKNEQRHFCFPGVSEEPMNLEYFAQYVSSS